MLDKYNIIVIGSSGHSRVAIDILEYNQEIRIAGLIDRYKKKGSSENNYKVLGSEEDIPHLSQTLELHGYFVAIGDNHIRQKVSMNIMQTVPELSLCSAIHPTSVISSTAQISEGVLLAAFSHIGPFCRVKTGCILNTRASLDHDSYMSDFSSLGPGAITGGYCEISQVSAIGIGSTLRNNISVGGHTVIGAGSVVTKNIPAHVVAYGIPARVIRNRTEGDPYL